MVAWLEIGYEWEDGSRGADQGSLEQMWNRLLSVGFDQPYDRLVIKFFQIVKSDLVLETNRWVGYI
jgi:hypothetical protein